MFSRHEVDDRACPLLSVCNRWIKVSLSCPVLVSFCLVWSGLVWSGLSSLVWSGRACSGLVWSGLVLLVLPCQERVRVKVMVKFSWSCLAVLCRRIVFCCLVLPCPFSSCRVVSYRVVSCLSLSCLASRLVSRRVLSLSSFCSLLLHNRL